MEIQIGADSVIEACGLSAEYLLKEKSRVSSEITELEEEFREAYLQYVDKKYTYLFGLIKTDKVYVQCLNGLSAKELYVSYLEIEHSLFDSSSDHYGIHLSIREKQKILDVLLNDLKSVKNLQQASEHAARAGTLVKLDNADLRLVTNFMKKSEPYR